MSLPPRLLIAVLGLMNFITPQVSLANDLFQKAIRPLFEKNCLSCHNSQDLKGGLSLESWALLRKGGESGEVIVPGKAESSYLLDLITSVNGKAEMPKGASPLSAEEIESVRTWIDQGANWPENQTLVPEVWWSLRPLMLPQIPDGKDVNAGVENGFIVRTPVDAFILKELVARGLQPSPEADKQTLIRRLYYDLIGLPPTPEETERFVRDSNPQAYEILVDQLLGSPQYGERWARHWLDVVKYADTCGYDKDKLRRNAWPYRDYVIRSLNEDKPYTRFVHEQVAGDVLFPGERDGILGLGFIAAGPWDHIGHAEVSEDKIDGKIARSLDRDDMVGSTLNTFCSATIQCARCHDHKFDPYTQAHYYGLQAVFAAVDRADRPYDLDQKTEQQRFELERSLKQQQVELARVQNEMKKRGGKQLAQLTAQIEAFQPSQEPQNKAPQFGYHSLVSNHADEQKWVQIDLGGPRDLKRIVLHACHDDFAGIGAGFGFPVRFHIQAAVDANDFESGTRATMLVDRTDVDFTNPGLIGVDFPVSAQGVRYVRITATQLSPRLNDFIFALAELQVFDSSGANLALHSEVTAKDSIELAVRWSTKNLTDGLWAMLQNEDEVEPYLAAVKQRDELLDQLRTPEIRRQMDVLTQAEKSLRKQLAALPASGLVYAAATHFPSQGTFHATQGKPREVRILHRGNVQDPREIAVPGAIPVIPGVPVAFELPSDHSEADRRAALALWITRADHPLTWRSIVNRVWQFHFGEGLAASPNDFGKMGRLPTHPELLDWLAIQFRDGGQSFKQLHRLLVTSSVYRQSSANHEANAAVDGSNQYLWRMNRRRLEAEEIRDAILSVSGCLDLKMGGPGYFLFSLEKETHSPHFEYHHFNPEDPASHRRSIYRFIVRSQPDPYMTTLDCADSSQSTPRRTETVTALQALAMLNNKFNLVMSKKFATRLMKVSVDKSPQVDFGFELITGRLPSAEEHRQLQEYADRFGMVNLCRLLFSLNEFVYID